MKFSIITFGCQMNVADSQWLARALSARGFAEGPLDGADMVILNTCSVRDKPEQKVYSELGRLEHKFKGKARPLVAVGGCVAQQVGASMMDRFARVRLVFGTDGLAMVPEALERLAGDPSLRLSLTDFSQDFLPRDPHLDDGPAAPTGFVTIMQGCDNYCAYCIVPFVRGRQKSRPAGDILAECRALAERGARDITLLGQNVNSYGQDNCGDGTGFADLLRHVAAIPGVERLRFTTSHPKDLSPEVIRAFGDLPNLAPRLHLPLQSGSDTVLARMGRKYDTARYLSLVDALRQARPDIELTTDLIVGFPGETDADLHATLDVMGRVRFMHSFSFKYSDRPGARATKMEPKVPDEEKSARLEALQNLQDELTTDDLRTQVGKTLHVLFEGGSRHQKKQGFSWRGRDPWGRTINVPVQSETDLTGSTRAVRILTAKQHSLLGEMEGAP